MGDAASADNEWIELHNTGTTPVSLEGWYVSVTNVGSTEEAFSIPLKGSLAASAYGVLERTDDTSAPGAALLTYAGALVNTGAALSLYDPANRLMDRVAGGEEWSQAKGDNDTKHTAQKTADGWVSAPRSPGAPPSEYVDEKTEEVEEEDDDDTEDVPRKRSSEESKPVTIELTIPDTELVIEAEVPARAYVNQKIDLSASARGVGKTHLDSLSYQWNFGDLATAHGRQTSHAYTYPGEYVVTLKASFGRHVDTARAEIVVLPVAFSLSWSQDGLLHVHNEAKYEIDISGYVLRSVREMAFPDGTILLPQATLTLSPKQLGAPAGSVVSLFDQTGAAVARSTARANEGNVLEAAAPALTPAGMPDTVVSAVSLPGNFSFKGEVAKEGAEAEEAPEPQFLQEDRSLPEDRTSQEEPRRWPYIALAGVLGLGCLGVLAGRIN